MRSHEYRAKFAAYHAYLAGGRVEREYDGYPAILVVTTGHMAEERIAPGGTKVGDQDGVALAKYPRRYERPRRPDAESPEYAVTGDERGEEYERECTSPHRAPPGKPRARRLGEPRAARSRCASAGKSGRRGPVRVGCVMRERGERYDREDERHDRRPSGQQR